METRIDFLNWLSKKLYENSIGLYLTIGLMMSLPVLFTKTFGVPQLAASFVAYFIVAFLRAAYESVVVYESTVKSLSLPKMFILSFVTASAMALVAHFVRPSLGYFSIPVAILVSLRVVGKLRAELWPATERQGFFAELPAKLLLVNKGRYGFYALLVGIAYFACTKYGFDFMYAFAAAFFIGMIFEESYNLIKLYERDLDEKSFLAMILWSAFCAISSTAIIVVMIKLFGFPNQAATIAGVILLKLIQPLGSRKFILGV